MKTSLLRSLLARPLLVGLGMLLVYPAQALELRIPIPPGPDKVVRHARGLIHRAANEVKDVGEHAVSAARSIPDDDRARSGSRQKTTVTSSKAKPATVINEAPSSADYDPSIVSEGAPIPERKTTSVRNTPTRVVPPSDRMTKAAAPKGKTAAGGRQAAPTPVDPLSTAPPELINPSPAPPAPPVKDIPAPAPPAPPGTSFAPAPAAEEEGIESARPVPGKRGLVYPPGSGNTSADMIDVRDFKPGQVVRNPRTGKLFRVP